MMDKKVKGKTKFTAYAYRPYSAGFAAPIGPPTIPGPVIEAEIGDTVVVNFQNAVDVPVTIHPHGIFYSQEMDGAYRGRHTDPGGFVQKKQTFQYVWEAREGTEGAWLYHDHGPMDPMPVYKGLFGPLLVRAAGATPPTREFCLAFHSFLPPATGLQTAFYCINGYAYAGNTPTLQANIGDDVAFHVFAIDNDFHTFHIHGHRWVDPSGTVIDNETLGPGDSITASFVEDNPGRWFYHCHVFSHLHQGMNGWYVVSSAAALAAGLVLVGGLAIAPGAEAANRRISISNYQWSNEDVQVDLGEHVTWYWVGPDIVHSVTGDSPNSLGLDSDPGNNLPQHPVGDTFELSFDQPGTYSFRCKLHSSVRGTVTVSSTPGDPQAEPDPVPANKVDLKAPKIRDLALAGNPLRGRGGQLRFALGERSKIDADYYRLRRHGPRTYAGWDRWSAYVGYNEIRFGGRGKHFDAEPGRYLALLRATDRQNNTGKPRSVRFAIRPPKKG